MKKFYEYILPQKKQHWARMFILVIATLITFKYLVIPFQTEGVSMENSVMDGSWNLAVRIPFLLKGDELDYDDIVIVKFHRDKIFLLKRVVGKEGDMIAFKNGELYRNNKEIHEKYVNGPCDWNLEERIVKPGNVYVIGDNRTLSLEGHVFGQISKRKTKGVVLW